MLGAQGGGAAASQGGGATQGGAGGEASGKQSGGAESGGFDPQEALSELRKTREGFKKVSTDFDNYKKENEASRKTLERLKKAFAEEEGGGGGGKGQGDDLQAEFAELQEVLAQNQGKMPVTEKIAMRMYRSLMENQQTISELRKELAAVKQGVEHATDPATPVNQLAYSQMENFIQQSLDHLYGNDPAAGKSRKLMYEAVTTSLAEDLKELQKAQPQRWDVLRRNPAELQKVVQAALRGIVPPKAMEVIEQDKLRNTEMGEGELMGAWRELKELRDKTKDPAQREGLNREMIKIRQQFAAKRMAPTRGRTR